MHLQKIRERKSEAFKVRDVPKKRKVAEVPKYRLATGDSMNLRTPYLENCILKTFKDNQEIDYTRHPRCT